MDFQTVSPQMTYIQPLLCLICRNLLKQLSYLLAFISVIFSFSSFGALDQHVQNEGITLNLSFSQNASDYDKSRYLDAASEWLKYVKAVDGISHHTISIHFELTDAIESDGDAVIEEYVDIADAAFPKSATIRIHTRTHHPEFDPTDYQTTLRHELAHVFGIGVLTGAYLEDNALMRGPAYCLERSQAVRWYNHLYDNQYPCLPFSRTGDHLYDHVLIDDPVRYDQNGNRIPPLTHEVGANGENIGIITVAILDDLGYRVEYPEVSFLNEHDNSVPQSD